MTAAWAMDLARQIKRDFELLVDQHDAIELAAKRIEVVKCQGEMEGFQTAQRAITEALK